jgi:transcriptional regulator of NAD metabolism
VSETRRKAILEKLETSSDPITGTALADFFQVSRQVIVQDIALLRASGLGILATSNGYLIPKAQDTERLVKTSVLNECSKNC